MTNYLNAQLLRCRNKPIYFEPSALSIGAHSTTRHNDAWTSHPQADGTTRVENRSTGHFFVPMPEHVVKIEEKPGKLVVHLSTQISLEGQALRLSPIRRRRKLQR